MPRRRPFTILPTRERDEISIVRSRPAAVHSCESCGTLTTNEGMCPDCAEVRARPPTENWK